MAVWMGLTLTCGVAGPRQHHTLQGHAARRCGVPAEPRVRHPPLPERWPCSPCRDGVGIHHLALVILQWQPPSHPASQAGT